MTEATKVIEYELIGGDGMRAEITAAVEKACPVWPEEDRRKWPNALALTVRPALVHAMRRLRWAAHSSPMVPVLCNGRQDRCISFLPSDIHPRGGEPPASPTVSDQPPPVPAFLSREIGFPCGLARSLKIDTPALEDMNGPDHGRLLSNSPTNDDTRQVDALTEFSENAR